jgi:hypothetical protein
VSGWSTARSPVSFWVPGLLPTFNELEAARGRASRAPRDARSVFNAYNAMKAAAVADVAAHLGRRVRGRLPGPFVLAFWWVRADRRSDPDNIAGGGQKVILDALTPPQGGGRKTGGVGVIHCDGWHCIRGLRHNFAHVPNLHDVGVRIELWPVSP